MADDNDDRMIHLVSQEGESFDVQLPVAQMSELVKTMIDGKCVYILHHTTTSGSLPNTFIIYRRSR